jgi:hypothetical protein
MAMIVSFGGGWRALGSPMWEIHVDCPWNSIMPEEQAELHIIFKEYDERVEAGTTLI